MKRPMLPAPALLLLALITSLAPACATAPEVGVRPAFAADKVQRVAVVPFFALGRFGLSSEQLDQLLRNGEAAAVQALRTGGFEVIEPADFRARLDAAGAGAVFDDGILLRTDLSGFFEPRAANNEPSLEVLTLTTLAHDGVLQVDALLFGEVVYHTQTECNDDPRNYHAHALVQPGPSPPPTDDAQPCIVSHFQAKLIAVPTGEVMWFNRMLLQTYVDAPDPEQGWGNMARAVAHTLSGSHGLGKLGGGSANTDPTQRATSQLP